MKSTKPNIDSAILKQHFEKEDSGATKTYITEIPFSKTSYTYSEDDDNLVIDTHKKGYSDDTFMANYLKSMLFLEEIQEILEDEEEGCGYIKPNSAENIENILPCIISFKYKMRFDNDSGIYIITSIDSSNWQFYFIYGSYLSEIEKHEFTWKYDLPIKYTEEGLHKVKDAIIDDIINYLDIHYGR